MFSELYLRTLVPCKAFRAQAFSRTTFQGGMGALKKSVPSFSSQMPIIEAFFDGERPLEKSLRAGSAYSRKICTSFFDIHSKFGNNWINLDGILKVTQYKSLKIKMIHENATKLRILTDLKTIFSQGKVDFLCQNHLKFNF